MIKTIVYIDVEKELRLKFAQTLIKLEGRNYLEAMVAYAAAPTIQYKKPSSLLSFTSHGKNKALLWKLYGAEICKNLQLEFFILKTNKDVLMVIIYRRNLLERYVNHSRNQPFLKRMGYDSEALLEQKLEMLRQRFESLCPHEVGVFLGMPVEDVEGFIEHKGKNCLLCRYWKVYEKPRRAEHIFNAYDKARSSVAELVVQLHEKNLLSPFMTK